MIPNILSDSVFALSKLIVAMLTLVVAHPLENVGFLCETARACIGEMSLSVEVREWLLAYLPQP
jgi:hypothetical protein